MGAYLRIPDPILAGSMITKGKHAYGRVAT